MSGQLCEGGSDRRTSVDIYDFEERIGRAGLAKVDFEGLPLSRILRSPKMGRTINHFRACISSRATSATHGCSADGLIHRAVRFGDGLYKNEQLQQQSSSRPISRQQLTDLLIPSGTSIADMFSNSLTRLSSFANSNYWHRASWKCLAAQDHSRREA
jgi:hypothetical protein